MEKLEAIPLSLDIGKIKSKLRARDLKQLQTLLDMAQSLICARAIYEVCYIDERFEDAVLIDGIRFKSRVLRRNLDKVERIFPYVITIGPKLEEKADCCDDLLEKYFLDAIGNMALSKAREYLEHHLMIRFALDALSYMGPGSLADWPIEEQRSLFSLFKDGALSVGVRLTENLLMLPRKSVSGVYFPTEITFYSCQLCPRKGCEGRKAQYNEDLAKGYGL